MCIYVLLAMDIPSPVLHGPCPVPCPAAADDDAALMMSVLLSGVHAVLGPVPAAASDVHLWLTEVLSLYTMATC